MTQITTMVWSLTERQIFWSLTSSGPWETLCVSVLAAQLCPSLCDLMGWSPPVSSAHEIFQARVLE